MNGSGCSVCTNAVDRPVTCIPCGHVFCESCVDQSGSCTKCGANITSVKRIYFIERNLYQDGEQRGLGDVIQARIVWVREKTANIRPDIWEELQSLKALSDPYVKRLRQLSATAQAHWVRLSSSVQFSIFFLIVLILGLVLQDATNKGGVVQSCLLPLVGLLADIVYQLSSCLLCMLGQLVVCVGRCLLEVICMLGDVVVHLLSTIFLISKEFDSVPKMCERAVFKHISQPIKSFAVEIATVIIRLLFVLVQCCIMLHAPPKILDTFIKFIPLAGSLNLAVTITLCILSIYHFHLQWTLSKPDSV
ncbi:uncharacterized protein LOC121386768 [Gigantopelta aegis]|uniref:uncharacterized protein LOC121386768 n=1 Tax=Gigantopelta aegis TaxID=1735272 RepID=UPI001B88DCB6|nr:uncharacterized protein LOC121386768 [Gigantopelta aegis]